MPSPNEIPTVADYAHWGEEASAIWYEENRYDMLYGGEPDYDSYDDYDYDEDEYDDDDPDREMSEAEFERRTAFERGEGD